MPSLKAIRTRIASVKNTKKITAAMKLVAGARLRRAQDAIIAARPYAQRMQEVIGELAARSGHGHELAHPLLARRDEKRVAMIVLTSDRGLCGGFNSNINRRTERFLIDNADAFSDVTLHIVGKKGREYFKRRGKKIAHEWSSPATGDKALERAREIAHVATELFLASDVDAVYLVYNEFKSAMSQRVTVEPLLPVTPIKLDEALGRNDFKYEPSRGELLSHIVPLHIEVQIYRALLESIASEFGARMSAMDSATSNASDMIGRLTLIFNRARQAAITKELMEIVGGAEALKG
ncbi:MAG: ATP synthase F1 subunit gamma [Myxococcales bacterium]|nr:ATP synthase F1 subunit gamma [Myxococcales bacterium]